MADIRDFNTLFKNWKNIQFGDFLLFQKIDRSTEKETTIAYRISTPIFAQHAGSFIADMAMSFHYVKWWKWDLTKDPEIGTHYEWMDYIHILGHWKNKPKFLELLDAYRSMIKENALTKEGTFVNEKTA